MNSYLSKNVNRDFNKNSFRKSFIIVKVYYIEGQENTFTNNQKVY